MNKKITLLLLGLFAVAVNAKSANAFGSPFSIDNENFTLNNNFGVNNASGAATIDNTATPDGFGFEFDDSGTFLLLGADDPNDTINNGSNVDTTNATTNVTNTNVTATSPSFNLTQDNINAGLNVQFDWSFQGTENFQDNFFVALAPAGQSPNKLVLPPQQLFGAGNVDQNVDVSSYTPGDYQLVVSLSESTLAGNSAAGFDNIFVSEVAPPPPATPVPFGAAPNTGIFILGSLYAGSSYLKRRKMSK